MLNEMNQNKKVMNLVERNWNIFKDIVEFLRQFKETCKASCYDKYPPLGVVVPLYNSLLDHDIDYVANFMTVNGSEPELESEPEPEPEPNPELEIGSYSETLPGFKLKRYRKSPFVAANAAHKVLNNYYDVSSDAYTIATVLDPHLKLEYFQPAGNESKEDSSTTHEPTCQNANMPKCQHANMPTCQHQ
jgi:hypothetical protein